jgi:hypothetical protein
LEKEINAIDKAFYKLNIVPGFIDDDQLREIFKLGLTDKKEKETLAKLEELKQYRKDCKEKKHRLKKELQILNNDLEYLLHYVMYGDRYPKGMKNINKF